MKFQIKSLLIILLTLCIFSCRKDNFINDNSAKLEFSLDTVIFDTVFTTIGSTTKRFKVYNRHNQPVKVSSVYLAKGNNSNFRININGIASNSVKDIVIYAKDSIFIFVEVTIDPTGENLPMVVQDSIIFITNGNFQDVKLAAWGQDAIYYNGEIICNTTWTAIKPYVIYNSILVDTNCTLTIEAGTQVHFHKGSGILVMGKIIVNGTLEEPVVFQGDRLEYVDDDAPGQWGGIILFNGSYENVFEYAEIKNSTVGIQVGTLDESGEHSSVRISNCKIENISYAGIFAIASEITAYNCVIANCGFYAVALLVGGNYEFYHCTMANYWSHATRTEPSLVISNNVESGENIYIGDLEKAYFGNCIIYGNKENELGLGNNAAVLFNYKLDHCLLKVENSFDTSDTTYYNNIIKDAESLFVDISKYDYQLDTLSAAKDKGDNNISNSFPELILDLNGENRTLDIAPDLGAYERIE